VLSSHALRPRRPRRCFRRTEDDVLLAVDEVERTVRCAAPRRRYGNQPSEGRAVGLRRSLRYSRKEEAISVQRAEHGDQKVAGSSLRKLHGHLRRRRESRLGARVGLRSSWCELIRGSREGDNQAAPATGSVSPRPRSAEGKPNRPRTHHGARVDGRPQNRKSTAWALCSLLPQLTSASGHHAEIVHDGGGRSL